MFTEIKFDRVEVNDEYCVDLFVAAMDGHLYLHEWVGPDMDKKLVLEELDLGEI